MTDRELKRRCRALAKRECANYFDGRCLDPDLVNGNEPKCAVTSDKYSIEDGGIICDYCLYYVLPLEPDLNQRVWGKIHKPPEYLYGGIHYDQAASSPEAKKCAVCGKVFLQGSNRSKYCSACRKVEERRGAARRMREHRAKHG